MESRQKGHQRETFDRIARNSAVVLIAKVIEAGSGFFMAMILFRYLGPEYFGDYAYVTALVLALQPLVNLELNTILIRDLAREPRRKGEFLGGAMLLKGILLVCFIAVVLGMSDAARLQMNPLTRQALYLAALGEVFQQVYWIFSPVFMAAERMVFETWISAIYRFWTLGGVLLLAVLDRSGQASPDGFLLVFVVITAGHAIRMLLGIVIVKRRMGLGKMSFRWRISTYLFRQMWIMGIATFCTGLSLRVDIFILKLLRGPTAVSMFHLPHLFVLQSQILAVSVVTAVFPVLSRWSDPDRQLEFMQIRDTTVRILAFVGLSIALLSSLFSPVIIRVLSGRRYPEAETVLVVLAWCIPILFLNFFGANLLTSMKRQTYLIYGAVLSLVMNIWLDLLWIPRFGPLGAAWGTLLSYGAQLGIIYIFLRHSDTHPFHALKLLGGAAALSLGSLVLGMILPQNGWTGWLIQTVLVLIAVGLMYLIQPKNLKVRLMEMVFRRPSSGDGRIYGK